MAATQNGDVSRAVLQRQLFHQVEGGRVEVAQADLQFLGESLVILGEAGMGKSTLLSELAKAGGHCLCSARRLVNAASPSQLIGTSTTLVIDALDEVTSRTEGDAVDLVLRRLDELHNPRFILSCRVADWRNATAVQGITEQYGTRPLILHLEPLTRDEACSFLADSVGLARANEIVSHFEELGLGALLGNPQTLELIERVALEGALPGNRGELFERAVHLMWPENREDKQNTPLARLNEETALDAAGSAFAGLILAGKEALSRKPALHIAPDDLSLEEVKGLSAGSAVEAILDSRLVRSLGDERFTYVHRSIGEFLGARWLARRADTPRKRRRLLALFKERGLVAASLRGLHAWLARNSGFATEVILADPMGVIEHGDADRLSVEEARTLLEALATLAVKDPRFSDSWTRYRLRGVVQPGLAEDVRQIVVSSEASYSLRTLLLDAVRGSPIAPILRDDLHRLLMDADTDYGVRLAAGNALVTLGGASGWELLVETLRAQAANGSLQLAVRFMENAGYEHLSDRTIVETLFAATGMSLSPLPERYPSYLGQLDSLKQGLPDCRLDSFLDELGAFTTALVEAYKEDFEPINDAAFALIARRMQLGPVDPMRLWRWLEPLRGPTRDEPETCEAVAEHFRNDDALRQAIQRYVLFEQPGSVPTQERAWRLSPRSYGLSVGEEDVIQLLGCLSHADSPNERQTEQWRDLLQLIRHDAEEGASARAAARSFAAGRQDLLDWLDELPKPVPEGESWEETQRRERDHKREARWAGHLAAFQGRIGTIRNGDYEYLLPLALAYLNLFRDLDYEVPPQERIAECLTPDVRDAALEGFDAFLRAEPGQAAARDIAESHAQGRRSPASLIVVAAIAERIRTGRGITGVSDDRLTTAFLELKYSHIRYQEAFKELTEEVERELRLRGIWEGALRIGFEAQLEQQCTYVDGLSMFLEDRKDADLSRALAAEWLERFPEMSVATETKMIDRLIVAADWNTLRRLYSSKLVSLRSDRDRLRNWKVVAFLVDFAAYRKRLQGMGHGDEKALMAFRNRMEGEPPGIRHVELSTEQLAWIIGEFRSIYPPALTDNTLYLRRLINRLANDPSDEAISALTVLRDAPEDGYSWWLRVAAAEQRRKRAGQDYRAPSIGALAAVLTDSPPRTVADLQAVMLEELDEVQKRIVGDPADPWRGYFRDDGRTPHHEERCRDHILTMLGPRPGGLVVLPEGHLADDNRADILCLFDGLRLPVEVKGQWHPDLWHAADSQLDRLYAPDFASDRRGIYLVLWFGPGVAVGKKLRSPGRGEPRPTTSGELREALVRRSLAAQDGRVQIVVLDLSRP